MYEIGFDVGGTNIKVGLLDANFKLVASRSFPFPIGESPEKIASLMAENAREILSEHQLEFSSLSSVGAAIPGSIDPDEKIVIHAHNLRFHNVPFKEMLEKQFPGIPVNMANDASAATLAELHFGALKGCKTAVLLTLGTGVGGGLILDGKVFNGGLGHGVELGHMIMLHGGESCTCGNDGCVESYCSATWIINEGKRLASADPSSFISQSAGGNPDSITAKLVIDAAKRGDDQAIEIFDQYIDYLSDALASLTVLVDPEKIALGGGVSLSGDILYKPLCAAVKRKSYFHAEPTIIPAELGNDAGMTGAAMLATFK